MNAQTPYNELEHFRIKDNDSFVRFMERLANYKLILLEQLASLENEQDFRFLQGRIYEINQIIRIFGKYFEGRAGNG